MPPPGLSHVVAQLNPNSLASRGSERSKRARSNNPATPTIVGGASFSCSGSFVHDVHDDGTSSPQGRGSRHIPNRDAMDMRVASYNLHSDRSESGRHHRRHGDDEHHTHRHRSHHSNAHDGGSGAVRGSSSNFNPNDLSMESVNSSSSFRGPSRSQHRALSNHPLGGDVFRFGRERQPDLRAASTSMSQPTQRSERLRKVSSNSKCFRVLDAPGVTDSSQLLDWSRGNILAIGLRQQIYAWNGDTRSASLLASLSEDDPVSRVKWLHDGESLIVASESGPVDLFDPEKQRFTHSLRPPVPYGSATAIAANGPIVAIGVDTPENNVCLFDVRARRPFIVAIDAHNGPVSVLDFCTDEPFYLASGGDDGAVQIWDVRQFQRTARYSFPRLTASTASRQRAPPVTALHWNTERRSHLYAGSADGMLRVVDTHQRPQYSVISSVDTGSRISGIRSSLGTGEVLTCQHGGGAPPGSSHTLPNPDGSILRNAGHLQLRRAGSLAPVGSFFSWHGPSAALGAVTLAPDGVTVCATHLEGTIKFWHVFDQPAPPTAADRDASVTPSHMDSSRAETPVGGGDGSFYEDSMDDSIR
jgi:WD40 repeat protein